MSNNISTHITFAEATKSQESIRLGIPNNPTPDHLDAMQHVAENVFERVRAHFGVPIFVSSFYRSPNINKAIGGAPGSQHCKGEAMDIDAEVFGKITNAQIFDHIKNNLDFDQLIWEFGDNDNPAWVHVSLKQGLNRRQILRARTHNGRTSYEPWH